MALTDLPGNVMAHHILLKLPVKSLVQCSFVNKYMCSEISDPLFIDMHLNETSAIKHRYIILKHISDDGESEYYSLHCPEKFDEHMKLKIPFGQSATNFDVAGSSNGLLFILCPKNSESGCSLHFWNPMIRYVKDIPDAPVPCSPPDAHVSYGFGFLPMLNDYRVVKIVYREKVSEVCLPKFPPTVELYSLKTDSWKRIETFIPCLWIDHLSRDTLKGSAYWIARKMIDETSCTDLIVSFDMVNEVFKEIMVPDCCLESGGWLTGSIIVFEGTLHLFVYRSTHNDWSVWVMQEEGSATSWSRKFTIEDPEFICWPLCFMDDGLVLFVNIDQVLVLYDPETNLMTDFDLDGNLETFDAIPFVESLVFLDKKNEALIEHYNEDMHDMNNNVNQL